MFLRQNQRLSFESSVNPKGIKTSLAQLDQTDTFESSVNPKGIKTLIRDIVLIWSLRVV